MDGAASMKPASVSKQYCIAVYYSRNSHQGKLELNRTLTLSAPRCPEGDPRVLGGSARGHFNFDWLTEILLGLSTSCRESRVLVDPSSPAYTHGTSLRIPNRFTTRWTTSTARQTFEPPLRAASTPLSPRESLEPPPRPSEQSTPLVAMSGYGTRRSSAQQVRRHGRELFTLDRALTGAWSRRAQTAPISISVAESPNAAANSPGALGASPYGPSAFSYGATTLSSSAGKLKRPSGINKTRRLSTSNQLRPASLLSQSMPSGPLPASGGRGRSSSISNNAHTHIHDHDFEEAESPDATHSDAAAQPHLAKLGGRKDRDRIQSFECEICSKKYRHSTCLIKHRWVSPFQALFRIPPPPHSRRKKSFADPPMPSIRPFGNV